jgi:iron complex transport system substrate-binding protein
MSLDASDTHASFPRRIVCLSDEAAELIYLLREDHRIVGVSGFSTRPAEVRSKPKVSSFRDANFDAIAALNPDLLITYSDVQADITREASLRGLTVLNCNQRSLAEIYDTLAMLSRILGKAAEGDRLIADWQFGLHQIATAATRFTRRPRVYFEEWNDPLISGIQWVEDRKAKDRVVSWEAVIERNPDVIFASWCGMKVNKGEILARPGADLITAVRKGQIHEIPSSLILQPGPAALTEGVRIIHQILSNTARTTPTHSQAQ